MYSVSEEKVPHLYTITSPQIILQILISWTCPSNTDMIQLGLTRIHRLLQHTSLSWPAIHVAGTNGKGSVCAYASAMLKASQIRAGKFTSPHLIDRWDCISIDEETIDEKIFLEVERSVRATDESLDIKATEFELLTATAFTIFTQEKIDFGVIEAGLGGKLDATNILPNPAVTVITKIGMDHQAFLGDTIEEIASQKAGIMKKGVPCIVDGTNTPIVLDVLREHARLVDAGPIVFICPAGHEVWDILSKEEYEDHQQSNICAAFEAVKMALRGSRYSPQAFRELLHVIPKVGMPGRLQKLSIAALTGRESPILLDGAHNVQSAEVLCNYVDKHLRQSRHPVTWLMAFSKGKDIQKILSTLMRPGDRMLATGFSPVDGMPWVQSADLSQILKVCNEFGLQHNEAIENIVEGLQRASILSNEGPLVVAGSLYLVSDVLRLLSQHSNNQHFE